MFRFHHTTFNSHLKSKLGTRCLKILTKMTCLEDIDIDLQDHTLTPHTLKPLTSYLRPSPYVTPCPLPLSVWYCVRWFLDPPVLTFSLSKTDTPIYVFPLVLALSVIININTGNPWGWSPRDQRLLWPPTLLGSVTVVSSRSYNFRDPPPTLIVIGVHWSLSFSVSFSDWNSNWWRCFTSVPGKVVVI